MQNSNLTFNIIPFDFPVSELIFYFSLEDIGKCSRIHRMLFPNDIEIIFPGIKADDTEFIYTTFSYAKEGFVPLDIYLETENRHLVKKYLNGIIYRYLTVKKNLIVRRGFIGENQVWAYASRLSTIDIAVYLKFSLKIQFCNVSNYPELLLSYDGKSKVLKTNLIELIKVVPASNFNWVLKYNHLYKYQQILEHDDPDFENTFPVLGFDLKNALHIEPEDIKKTNRYKKYKEYIETFYSYYLNTSGFKEIIPLHNTGFLNVDESLIFSVDDISNELAYQYPQTGRTPKRDFAVKRPFKKCDYDNVHLFFIYHENDAATKDLLRDYLLNGLGHYRGLTNYAGVLFYPDEAMDICFQNRDYPLIEIEHALSVPSFMETDIKYLAIYLTPFSKAETQKQKIRVYVRVKELLLKRNIACQFVEPETVLAPNENFKFSLTTMSIAIQAKLGGIPWQLFTKPVNELIVGIGSFKHPDGVQFLSSAFSFSNTGHFNEFDYFMKHQTSEMAGSIASKVKEFAASHGNPARLIIHFYKEQMTDAEIAPIEAALKDLQLPNPIPIFIVHVNKTESEDIIAYDTDWKDNWMPYSGTYISIGNKKYLLFNNSRYKSVPFIFHDGYPFPIKLSIDCTQNKYLDDDKTIKDLINQVYQFSRLYFKSLAQQNLPVTVKYPEIIAELAPYMLGKELPDNSKNKLWFL